jgi:hypothetical protein
VVNGGECVTNDKDVATEIAQDQYKARRKPQKI